MAILQKYRQRNLRIYCLKLLTPQSQYLSQDEVLVPRLTPSSNRMTVDSVLARETLPELDESPVTLSATLENKEYI